MKRRSLGGQPSPPTSPALSQRQTSVFLATANAEGQPYIQHRGGPPGFLHVLDDKTIAFADSSASGNTSPPATSPTTGRRICF